MIVVTGTVGLRHACQVWGSEPSGDVVHPETSRTKVASSSEDSCTWSGLRGHEDLRKPMEWQSHIRQGGDLLSCVGQAYCGQGWASMHRLWKVCLPTAL